MPVHYLGINKDHPSPYYQSYPMITVVAANLAGAFGLSSLLVHRKLAQQHKTNVVAGQDRTAVLLITPPARYRETPQAQNVLNPPL